MKKGFFKSAIVSALVLSLLLVGCSSKDSGSSEPVKGNENLSIDNVPERFASGEETKIKVIRKIGGDDHTAQFLAGAKAEGEAMGFKVDVFSANGDTAKFHDAIAQAIQDNYDGLIISHGDDAAIIDAVKEATEKGIEVVTFDSNGELSEVSGVTLTSQDDEALASLALDQLIDDFKVLSRNVNIVYLWVDGFPPMVRRNAVYTDRLDKNPSLQEIERFGVAAADTSVQTQNAVAAMLNKHPEGQIDAIFATWDAFAIGAARAIKEAGRDEIKIYGIDVSNADLEIIQAEESPWVYTAAVDPKLIGEVNLRILAKKLAGEETPQFYDLEASLISQEELHASSGQVNMVTLADIVPGWGQTTAFEEDWMNVLKDHYKK